MTDPNTIKFHYNAARYYVTDEIYNNELAGREIDTEVLKVVCTLYCLQNQIQNEIYDSVTEDIYGCLMDSVATSLPFPPPSDVNVSPKQNNVSIIIGSTIINNNYEGGSGSIVVGLSEI